MKILIVLHDYLPLHTGGSEVHAHQSGAELARRGHDVTALFTERDLSRPVGEIREGTLDGVRTLEVVHQREYADVRETWTEAGSLALFEDLLARERPDIVHFHHLAIWGSGVLRAARNAGARTVVTLHDYHLLCDVATLLTPANELCTEGLGGACTSCIRRHPVLSERWDDAEPDAIYARAARERFEQHRADLRCADAIVAPSHYLAETFERAGFLEAADAVVLKAGYPGPLLPPRTREAGRPLRVGYVGGLYTSKGVHVLVDAFARLKDVPCELHVHGHLDWFPEYVADVKQRAAGLPVHFHGSFDPPQIDSILQGFDVFVLPSIWVENMPITIQEAFRNGLPVVTTDLGGMAEAVADGVSGLTFPRGDAAALAAALRRLATDAALYDRLAAGRPHVPTLEEVVDRLEEIYVPG